MGIITRAVRYELFPDESRLLTTLEYVGRSAQGSAPSGVYCDVLDLGSGRVAFVMSEISEMSVGAALAVANIRAHFRHKPILNDLDDLPRSINHLLRESIAPSQRATFFVAIYDDSTRTLRYANSGHTPPVLVRANGDIERLTGTAAVTGLLDQRPSSASDTRLLPGDTLVIFTGGTENALIETIHANASEPPFSIAAESLAAAQAFRGSSQRDLTLVVARALPDWEVVRELVEELIDYLGSVSDDEKGKAHEAADILRRRLGDGQRQDIRSFQYDLGGKGIHDWVWNSTNDAQITRITNRYWDFFVSKKTKVV